jgi:PTS system mannose-specific IIA component
MIGTLILSQGGLARELVEATGTIVGTPPPFEPLELGWQTSREECLRRIGDAIDRLDTGDGVLVLTDMHGATPFNAAQELAANRHIVVLAGINLPMVVRLACCRPDAMPLEELAAWIEGKGRESIRSGSESSNAVVGCERESDE